MRSFQSIVDELTDHYQRIGLPQLIRLDRWIVIYGGWIQRNIADAYRPEGLDGL